MPTGDRRTVGELLADCDLLAREALLDLSADQSAAMVRTWGQVVDAAARLWAVLPSAVPERRFEPDLMPRLRQMAHGIAATTSAGHWPGPGSADERLLQIAQNLSRARILVVRFGGDVHPTTGDVRADIAAARARIMHTLYVAAHGTAVAITEHTKELQDHLQMDVRRRRPVVQRPSTQEIKAAQGLSIRFGVFEQLVGGYVAAHPVTPAVLGEARPVPPASRLQSVLAGWDIQAHRTLLASPAAADLVRVARIQALIASATAVVSEVAASQGSVDRQIVQRAMAQVDPVRSDDELRQWRLAHRRAGGGAKRQDARPVAAVPQRFPFADPPSAVDHSQKRRTARWPWTRRCGKLTLRGKDAVSARQRDVLLPGGQQRIETTEVNVEACRVTVQRRRNVDHDIGAGCQDRHHSSVQSRMAVELEAKVLTGQKDPCSE